MERFVYVITDQYSHPVSGMYNGSLVITLASFNDVHHYMAMFYPKVWGGVNMDTVRSEADMVDPGYRITVEKADGILAYKRDLLIKREQIRVYDPNNPNWWA